MAKKSKLIHHSKKQVSEIKSSVGLLNRFYPWALSILILLVSIAISPTSQSPTIDFKWYLLETGAIGLTLIWMILCAVRRSWNWVSYPINFPLLIFILWMGICQIIPSSRAYISNNFIQYISFICIYVLISQTVKEGKGFRLLIHGLLIGGLIAAIYGILQKIGIDPISWQKRGDTGNISSLLGNSNLFGWFLAALFPLSITFLFVRSRNTIEKIIRVLYVVFIAIALTIVSNRAGVLSAIGSMLIIVWMIMQKPDSPVKILSSKMTAYLYNARRGIRLIIGLLILVGLVAFWHHYASRSDIAIKGRFLHWATSIQMVLDHPLVGIGPGNYLVQYLEYQAKVLNDPRFASFRQTSQEVGSMNAEFAHNEFLQALTDNGILGFSTFLFLVLTYLIIGYRTFFKFQEKDNALLFLGCYGGVSALLISCLFGFPLHVPASGMQFWVLVGISVSIGQLENIQFSHMYFWPEWIYTNFIGRVCKTYAFQIITSSLFMILGVWTLSLSLDSFRASYYIREGRFLAENENNMPGAIQYIEQAVTLAPHNGLAHYYLGGYYARLKRYDDAIREYSQAIKSYNDIHMYYNLGQIYYLKEDYPRAEEYYKKTLYLDSSMYQCHRQLGLIYGLYRKETNKAISELKLYLELDKSGKDADAILKVISELGKQIPK